MKSQFLLTATILLALGTTNQTQAQRDQPPDKKDPPKTSEFKPLEINNELNANDVNDGKLNQPSKKYTVKLVKDKTYIIELNSTDFDAYLRLLDKNGKQLAEDDDSGGDLNSLILYVPTETADHEVVAITLDGQLGKFTLKVREFIIKGEAKPRAVGNGVNLNEQIGNNDKAQYSNKLGKLYSFEFKAGSTYTIDLGSQVFDSYLYLFDGKSGKLLAQDDDSGGNLDSRIVYRAERDGVYHVFATSLGGRDTGAFTLSVRKND
jgi:hypothetical protein